MTYAISKTNQKLIAQSEALKKIHEHNRDYLSLKITIPLGNKALKNVHTNQWLFTDLPKEFDLANWTILAEALNSNTNRYEQYIKNRWYIENIDINVEANGKAEMVLTVNAFASSYQSFSDASKNIQKAYTDAVEKEQKEKEKNKNKTNAVTKSKTNTSLKGGWGKWLDTWVKNVVGMETDPLRKAKLIDKKFKSETYYSGYSNAQKTGGNVANYEKAYKTHHLNCADGGNILCGAFNSAGINANIMHTSNHYIVRLTINGKYYWTDCSGANGSKCNKAFNVVYGSKGGSFVGKKTR